MTTPQNAKDFVEQLKATEPIAVKVMEILILLGQTAPKERKSQLVAAIGAILGETYQGQPKKKAFIAQIKKFIEQNPENKDALHRAMSAEQL